MKYGHRCHGRRLRRRSGCHKASVRSALNECTLVAETQTEDLFVIGRFMLTLSLGRELNHWLARYSPFVFTLSMALLL
jgi:hypothetical protein